jgi:hypothetical protein
MYARIPALLEHGMTKTEIAAMCGVKLGTLVVFCSRRGISLRKRVPRTKLVLPDEPLPLSNDVLKSLREAARLMGKSSTARLVSDLLEKIVSDDLYKAVLDEEAAWSICLHVAQDMRVAEITLKDGSTAYDVLTASAA